MSQYNSPADIQSVFRRMWERLGTLERSVQVTHGSGPPPANAIEPYVDDTNSRVYYKVGGTTWKYTTLVP